MNDDHKMMICEACGCIIEKGDLGTTTINGGHLCCAHTPMLSEIVSEYNAAIVGGNYHVYEFPTLAAMKAFLKGLVRELTTVGDRSTAVPL